MDTSDLQKLLKKLLGEEVPRRTLWRWVEHGRVAPPEKVPRGEGRGRGRHVEWSEKAVGDIVTSMAIRKISRAKRLSIEERTFSSCPLLKAVSLAYTDLLPVRHGSSRAPTAGLVTETRASDIKTLGPGHVWKGVMDGTQADVRIAEIDSLGCKQVFLLPSPFIPLPGEPRVPADDEIHAATVAAIVIAFEKHKQDWPPDRPARVVFPWYLEFPLIRLSQYADKGDWHIHDSDHLYDYDMVCVRDGVLLENADSDELIICLDSRIVLEVRGGGIGAYLPWFMARRGYRSGQSGRRYPGLPLVPLYLRSKPTRPNERAAFRIRRRRHRAVSDRAPPRDGIRKRVKKKSGYLRPWKRRRAKGAVGSSAPVVRIDIRLIKPRSLPD